MKSLEQGHIPNFNTILYYSELGGPLNKVNPWTKFLALMLFVLASTIIQNVLFLIGLYGLALLIYCLGRLPLKKLFTWSLFPMLFILSISFLFIFEKPGAIVLAVPGLFSLTDGGIVLLVSLFLRGLAVVTYTLSFMMSTKYSQLTFIAKKLLPWPYDIIFLLTFRFIFIVFEVIDTALLAAWARGGNLRKGITSMGTLYARIFALGVLYSFDRAERVGKAMEARGFSGKISIYENYTRPSILGIVLIVISLILLLVIYSYQGVFP